MAEITYTLADVRRAIGRTSRQDFFLKFGDTNQIICSSGATTTVIPFLAAEDPPGIVQDSDYWAGDWLYDVTLAEERQIMETSSGGNITVEGAFSVAASSGDPFEIWGLWPPSVVKDAINRSHRHSWRLFPDVVISEALVVTDDTLRYGLLASDMTTPDVARPGVAEVLQVWIENSQNAISGQVTSTNASLVTFNDTESSFDSDLNVDSDWLISIYDGECRGQLRQLNSIDTDGLITVDTGWDSDGVGLNTPTTDSKFKIWDPTSDSPEDWTRITNVRYDQPEDPDFMYLTQFYPAYMGMRIRLSYLAQTTDFDTDADITRTPLEYLVYKSLSLIYSELVPDNRHDRAAHAATAEYWNTMAEKFAREEGKRLPAQTWWSEEDYGDRSGRGSRINPLDWDR